MKYHLITLEVRFMFSSNFCVAIVLCKVMWTRLCYNSRMFLLSVYTPYEY